jgi:hypothetical protein
MHILIKVDDSLLIVTRVNPPLLIQICARRSPSNQLALAADLRCQLGSPASRLVRGTRDALEVLQQHYAL